LLAGTNIDFLPGVSGLLFIASMINTIVMLHESMA